MKKSHNLRDISLAVAFVYSLAGPFANYLALGRTHNRALEESRNMSYSPELREEFRYLASEAQKMIPSWETFIPLRQINKINALKARNPVIDKAINLKP